MRRSSFLLYTLNFGGVQDTHAISRSDGHILRVLEIHIINFWPHKIVGRSDADHFHLGRCNNQNPAGRYVISDRR